MVLMVYYIDCIINLNLNLMINKNKKIQAYKEVFILTVLGYIVLGILYLLVE